MTDARTPSTDKDDDALAALRQYDRYVTEYTHKLIRTIEPYAVDTSGNIYVADALKNRRPPSLG